MKGLAEMCRKLMTVREAARVLSVSRPRAYDLIRKGIIPMGVAVRLGRQLRVDAAALTEWIRGGGGGDPYARNRDE